PTQQHCGTPRPHRPTPRASGGCGPGADTPPPARESDDGGSPARAPCGRTPRRHGNAQPPPPPHPDPASPSSPPEEYGRGSGAESAQSASSRNPEPEVGPAPHALRRLDGRTSPLGPRRSPGPPTGAPAGAPGNAAACGEP